MGKIQADRLREIEESSVMFSDFLSACGLVPRSIESGKWHRCPTINHPKKKNGSFKLANDGRIGWAIDYAVHSEHQVWREEGKTEIRIDRAEIVRRHAQEAREARIATDNATAHYRAARPLDGPHPYLDSKELHVGGCGGLRVDGNGRLLVPMLIGGKLSSIQAITPDGDKRYWPGARTSGASYEIGIGNLDVLCEGFATGLTIHHAIPSARVVVAFSAGNLARVAETMRRGYLAVVAADNDHATELRVGFNPGIEKAREAARLLGVGIAYPTCAGSDWDDYRQERLAEVREFEALKTRSARRDMDIISGVLAEISIAIKREAKRTKKGCAK